MPSLGAVVSVGTASGDIRDDTAEPLQTGLKGRKKIPRKLRHSLGGVSDHMTYQTRKQFFGLVYTKQVSIKRLCPWPLLKPLCLY